MPPSLATPAEPAAKQSLLPRRCGAQEALLDWHADTAQGCQGSVHSFHRQCTAWLPGGTVGDAGANLTCRGAGSGSPNDTLRQPGPAKRAGVCKQVAENEAGTTLMQTEWRMARVPCLQRPAEHAVKQSLVLCCSGAHMRLCCAANTAQRCSQGSVQFTWAALQGAHCTVQTSWQ